MRVLQSVVVSCDYKEVLTYGKVRNVQKWGYIPQNGGTPSRLRVARSAGRSTGLGASHLLKLTSPSAELWAGSDMTCVQLSWHECSLGKSLGVFSFMAQVISFDPPVRQ